MTLRLALAAIASLLAACALYALLRTLQYFVFPEPNPATVIWSAHAGYFWRAWTVTYAGGMAGFVTWIAARRDPARVARVLARATPIVAVIAAAQALLLP